MKNENVYGLLYWSVVRYMRYFVLEAFDIFILLLYLCSQIHTILCQILHTSPGDRQAAVYKALPNVQMKV